MIIVSVVTGKAPAVVLCSPVRLFCELFHSLPKQDRTQHTEGSIVSTCTETGMDKSMPCENVSQHSRTVPRWIYVPLQWQHGCKADIQKAHYKVCIILIFGLPYPEPVLKSAIHSF